MEYNTSMERLVMPEYGRHVQQMVDHLLTIEDREERTECANYIAQTMCSLFPKLREDANYKQKVWDHIAMMAGYRLDVDAPYPLPEKQEAVMKVESHLEYPMQKIRFRQYGHVVEECVRTAMATSDDYERLTLSAMIANYMKLVLLQAGTDINVEDKIVCDLSDMSDGLLHYDYAELQEALPAASGSNQPRQQQKYNNQQRYQKNNRQNNNQRQRQRQYGGGKRRY